MPTNASERGGAALKSGRRYATSGLVETQFEPGAGGRVFRNLLRIKRKREMDNMSKGHFPFAPAGQIPRLMAELQKGPLREFTPCRFRSLDHTVKALAVVHTELMLIHPFRDGNGRVGRLLAIVMALQAGLPPLNFGTISGRKRQEYFAAVRAGLDRNYEPMEKIFSAVIRRTIEIS